jgi:hypothetical protein
MHRSKASFDHLVSACEHSVRNNKPSALAVLRLSGKIGHAKTNSLLTLFVFDWTSTLQDRIANAADGLA